MRCGFTTGTGATAAAVAKLQYKLTGIMPTSVKIKLPPYDDQDVKRGVNGCVPSNNTPPEQSGERFLHIDITYKDGEYGVVKDAGDDPDVTHGIFLYADVSIGDIDSVAINGSTIDIDSDKEYESVVNIMGGKGVGRVTLAGLSVPVGSSAINPGPQAMLRENLIALAPMGKRIDVIIHVPNGAEIAKRTFNSRLGIIGGISILGSSGVVKPMSKEALIETIFREIDVRVAAMDIDKDTLWFVPGRIGEDALVQHIHVRYVSCQADDETYNHVGDKIEEQESLHSDALSGKQLSAEANIKLIRLNAKTTESSANFAELSTNSARSNATSVTSNVNSAGLKANGAGLNIPALNALNALNILNAQSICIGDSADSADSRPILSEEQVSEEQVSTDQVYDYSVVGNSADDAVLGGATQIVQMSNFVWEALTYAKGRGVKFVGLAGHGGKLAKVAMGAKNTHSRESIQSNEYVLNFMQGVYSDSAFSVDLPATINTIEEISTATYSYALDKLSAEIARRVNADYGFAHIQVKLFAMDKSLVGEGVYSK